jgi:murein DD-endopeptidase MepM/ murein hydrolase activator NlpD
MFRWNEGLTFLEFLQKNNLPLYLYENADSRDKQAIEDIQANSRCFILKDSNGSILQALIPLSEELQVHIYLSEGKYILENIPIKFETRTESFVIRIMSSSVFNEISKITNMPILGSIFIKSMKNRINFKRDIQKGSIVAMIYEIKYRLGYYFGEIKPKIILLKTGKRTRYVVRYKNRSYNIHGVYTEKQNQFIRPLKKGSYWISSKFTKKRWHPILKKYRAHLGVDYAAPRGTPIKSAGDGKIIYIGKSRGYGNLIKIKHADGYLTLYAHMKNFRKGLKRGMKVKKGEFIGRVGTTGLSTGPHLHFGLYKNGIAINPESIVSIKFKKKISSKNKAFHHQVKELKKQIHDLIKSCPMGNCVNSEYVLHEIFCENKITNFEENIDLENEIKTEDLEFNEKILNDNNISFPDEFDNEPLELSEDYQYF